MAAGGDHDQTPSAAFLVPSTRRSVGMTGRVGVGVALRQILHHFVPKQNGTDCNRCSQRELSGTHRVPTGADGDPGGEERLMGLRTRRAWPVPGADVGRGEPSPGADVAVAGASPVPVQMWQWQGRAQSRCRCESGRGEPSPGADVKVAGASTVPVQMWQWQG